jgi:hypothetical protein
MDDKKFERIFFRVVGIINRLKSILFKMVAFFALFVIDF